MRDEQDAVANSTDRKINNRLPGIQKQYLNFIYTGAATSAYRN